MLIITGQLQSIKDGLSRRILPEWVEATFKIAPRQPSTSCEERKDTGVELAIDRGRSRPTGPASGQ